jgi:hypothetical protein
MVAFGTSTKEARTFAEFKSTVDQAVGETGLMIFMELDLGAVVRKATGLDTLKIVRFVIG